MPKPTPEQLRDRARTAAVDFAPPATVGEFIGFIDESEDVISLLFASKQKGYVGWNWQVALFVADDEVTVSEINLMPGAGSLVAPNWVPWSERLADWKALQAEIEKQAAEATAAEESEEDNDEEDADEIDEPELVVEQVSETMAAEAESVPALIDQSDDAEDDSEDTGKRPPRFLRRRLGRLKHKKQKGDNPSK